MTRLFTEAELCRQIALLTPERLQAFLRWQVIRPLQSESGPRYRPVDVARLELLCDLNAHFGLEEDALELVMSLVDQLHDTRARLNALMRAIAAEDAAVRARLGRALIEMDAAEG